MRTLYLIFTLFIFAGLKAQTYNNQITSSDKKITDANTSLFHLKSNYSFPYVIPTSENITEKLMRTARFLEGATMKEFIDGANDSTISDYSNLNCKVKLAEGDFRPYSYEWGVTYSGMLKAAVATQDKYFYNYAYDRLKLVSLALPALLNNYSLDKKYKSPLHRLIKPNSLDDCGAMCAASIRMQSVDSSCNLTPIVQTALEYISKNQYRLKDGTLARNFPYKNTLWLDDLYMGVPALAEGYKFTGNKKYLDDAILQIFNFSKRMFVEDKKLFMHGWVESMKYHPQFFWGRANGWAMLAMCDLLDVMPTNHPKYKEILKIYKKHCEGLLQVQSGEGLWHQLLDKNDSFLETSCSAIFVYGFAKGINKGWIDGKSFGAATISGWDALSNQLNNQGQLENMCVGTSVSFDPIYYYNRLVHPYAAHGYGPFLLAGSEMLDLIKNSKPKIDSAIYYYDTNEN